MNAHKLVGEMVVNVMTKERAQVQGMNKEGEVTILHNLQEKKVLRQIMFQSLYCSQKFWDKLSDEQKRDYVEYRKQKIMNMVRKYTKQF